MAQKTPDLPDLIEPDLFESEPPRGPARDLMRTIASAVGAGDRAQLRALVDGLRAPDLADVLVALEAEERVGLIELLGADFDYEALSELPGAIRDQLSEALPNELLARAVTELDTDDAAYLLENLEESDQEEVLAQLPTGEREALERNLDYPEESAGRLMQADLVTVPPFWTVGQVIDYMRKAPDLPESFSEIFVVDPSFRVLGNVDLSRLLRTTRDVRIDAVMDRDRHLLSATSDQGDVAREFQRYDLMSAPVVDENRRLVGVVTVDDVVELIQEDAEKDFKRLAGVGSEETLADSVRMVTPSRFAWLFVNLLTAILASMVIKRFDTIIEQMVALAVLMPIVASMGGNAGTQTMTVAVRALATRELVASNVMRFAARELAVGLINGLAFAAIVGVIAHLWFGTPMLGVVFAAATTINLLAAAIAGICIPLALDKFGYDPAVSSTVFVTTVTDIIGFFSFLGLATLLLK
jgi:magnesium transporter